MTYSVFDGLTSFPTLATLTIMVVLIAALSMQMARRIHSVNVLKYVLLAGLCDFAFFFVLTVRSTILVRDAAEWHGLATEAALFLAGGTDVKVAYVDGKEGYIWILGALYAIGGASPILAIAMNTASRIVTLFCVAKSTEVMCSKAALPAEHTAKAVKAAAILAAVLPSFVIWSPQVLRESLTVMCVAAAAALAFVGVVRRINILVVAAILPLILLIWMRSTLGLSVTAALVTAIIYTFLGSSKYRKPLRAMFIVAALVTLPLTVVWLSASLGVTPERIVGSTAELSETASTGFPGLSWDANVPRVLSITVPRVAIGPFPWEWRFSGAMLLAQVEWACWILTLFLAWRALRASGHAGVLRTASWMMAFFVFLSGAILMGLTLTVANYGILARFRPIAMVALLPLAGLGVIPARRRSASSIGSRSAANARPVVRHTDRHQLSGRD